MVKVCVSRPAEGITINADIREFLLNQDRSLAIFDTRQQAIEYFQDAGWDEEDMEDLVFHEICQNCASLLEDGLCAICDEDN